MPRSTNLRVAAACLAAMLSCATAEAQLFRAYLAADGSDANPCTLQAPCRLLPAALNSVASSGEIWMLDSANYNTATVIVSKSVSILAVPGVIGSVLAIGGPAISIPASGLNVALRNLVVAPLAGGGGTDGVYMTGASTLTVESSLITNVPGNGIFVDGAGVLKVSDTTVRNNGVFGIVVANGASAMIARSHMVGNAGGFSAQVNGTAATSEASVSDSVVSGGSDGIHARAAVTGGNARISVTRTTIEKTTYGLLSYTSGCNSCGASVAVSGSMIVNNSYGWYQNGAGSVVRSLGNNHFGDNTQALGILTPAPLQ